jgi:HEAT repeat protein
MVNLSCPKCHTVLPVREDKIGKSNFVCPKCFHPLDAANRAAPPTAGWLDEKSGQRGPEDAPTLGMEAAFPGLQRPPMAAPQRPGPTPVPARDAREDAPTLGPEQAFAGLKFPPSKSTAATSQRKAPRSGSVSKALQIPAGLSKRRWLLGAGVGAVICIIAIAVWMGTRSGRPTQSGDIAEALKDRDAQVRARAVQALINLGPNARPLLLPLLGVLNDEDPAVRRLAAEALSKRGAPDGDDLPVLSLALQNPSSQVRLFAVGALSQLGSTARSEMPVLRELAEDDDPGVSKAAKDALNVLGKAEEESLRRRLETGSLTEREEAAQGLGQLGKAARPAVPVLIEALADKNAAVRTAAKGALVRIGPEVVPVLGEALQDGKPEVRRGAAQALAELGADSRDTLPLLIAAADEPALRKDAVAALAKIGRDAVPSLISRLSVEQSRERRALVRDVLVEIGPDAVPALERARKSPAPEVQNVAADALERIDKKSSVPAPELSDKARLVFDELLAWFESKDANEDGFLDKQELARAFRGDKATPPNIAAAPTAKELEQYPDAWFLLRLDRDGDKQISRDEFERWAREYAVVETQAADAQDVVNQTYGRTLALREQLAAIVAKGQVDAALKSQQANLYAALMQEDAVLRSQLLRQRAAEEAALIVLRRWAGPAYGVLIVRDRIDVVKTEKVTETDKVLVEKGPGHKKGPEHKKGPPHKKGPEHKHVAPNPPVAVHQPAPVAYRPPSFVAPRPVHPVHRPPPVGTGKKK